MKNKNFSITVKINKISFYRKKTFFKQKINLKGKNFFAKEIIIIVIATNLKNFQLEVAPLPNYQQQKLERYFFYLRKWQSQIEKKTLHINDKNFFDFAKQWNYKIPFTALQWAISSFLLSLYFWNKNKFFVKNNFLIVDLEENLENLHLENSSKDFLQKNYHSVYKIKIGRKNIEKEILILKKIIHFFKNNFQKNSFKNSSPKIRLDGNRLWTEKELAFFLNEMKEDLSFIEYMEEPIENYSVLHRYQNKVSNKVFFAIDESLCDKNFENFEKNILKKNFSVMVVKPSLLGCLSKIHHWIQWAEKNQIKVTISSCFESQLGHQMIFRCIYFWGLQNRYHGADTYRFLKF